tara:strand:- start:3359 stop:3721 length:363 start_codon:yes stop_codon:yes gene_type:complete
MKNILIPILSSIILLSGCRKNDLINADYEISVDETFQVELVSNPTTGYTWKWANGEFTTIVDSINWTYVADAPDLIGSGGKEIWEFRGVQTGIDTVKFEYSQSWDAGSTIDSIYLVIKVN